jgi:predicted HTH transcriptional regulator
MTPSALHKLINLGEGQSLEFKQSLPDDLGRKLCAFANSAGGKIADRLEISNPGGLVGGMELKDLGKRSVPRNPLLFGILYRMSLVEHVGSGIKRIKDALAAEKLPEAVLEVDEHWFPITFLRADRSGSPTGSPKGSQKSSQKIVEIMAREPNVTIVELSNRIGIGER